MAFTKITEYEGITEYKLDANDLNALLVPQRAAPGVALMVVYRVGSRNEAVGHTGSTHLLEHMLFKGTPTYNKNRGTQIAAVQKGFAPFEQIDRGNDGRDALVADEPRLIGNRGNLRDELQVGKAPKIDELLIEEGAQPVQQTDARRVRHVAQIGKVRR